MEKRIKIGLTPTGIVGLVFSLMGAMFLLVGILCRAFPEDADDKTVGIVFSILGLAFFVLGLIFLLVLLQKRKKIQKLVSDGNFLWGEIVDIVPNPYISYNHQPTYTVLTRYLDETGTVHIFRSPTVKTYPDRTILGRKVKIYYQDTQFKLYYVDTESGFPRIIEH